MAQSFFARGAYFWTSGHVTIGAKQHNGFSRCTSCCCCVRRIVLDHFPEAHTAVFSVAHPESMDCEKSDDTVLAKPEKSLRTPRTVKLNLEHTHAPISKC